MAKDSSAFTPLEIEAFDQKIEAAATLLGDVGKSPKDAVDFFHSIERGVILSGWSLMQRYCALKLGCLLAQRLSFSGSGTPRIAATLAEWLAEAEREISRRRISQLGGGKDKHAPGTVLATRALRDKGINSFKDALEEIRANPYTTDDRRYTVSVVFEKGCDWVVQLDNVSKSSTRISSGSFRTGYWAKIL